MKKKESLKPNKPWPTKDAMEQVYERNLWGGNAGEFYSGAGSHESALVEPYLDVLKTFLTSFDVPISVCDLGCGDFNIGKELVQFAGKYIAVDIVNDLIESNQKKFEMDDLEFRCLDIAKDDLPDADCAIIRQVLQHLSNDEVGSVVDKLAHYKYIILTEHLPEYEFSPNAEIISGQGIRLNKKSGVDLLAPPFNFQVEGKKELLSIPVKNYRGRIVTTLYEV